MISPVEQLILDFEPAASLDGGTVLLRLFNSEREYFNVKREPVPAFPVQLPRPFEQTAFRDSGTWRQTPRQDEPARSMGQTLWRNLPDEVRGQILAGSPGSPRRVAVLSTNTGLDDVPWEWLNDGPDGLIAATESVRFLRLVPSLYTSPPLTITPPVRVLIVITNPKDERLLDAYTEIEVIRQGLGDPAAYEVRVLAEPRHEALRGELEWAPHILHYVGHSGLSGTTGNLILHDESDGTRWLPASEVARVLPTSVRLLCLSTCVTAQNYQTGGLAKFAHCPAEIALPTAIVNQYALEPDHAARFWASFYPALVACDGNVVEAMHEARMDVAQTFPDDWSWASFSLVVRDGTGHPLRIARTDEQPEKRFAAEVQAQWAARLANSLATRMRSLQPEVQSEWESSLADEAARIESFEQDIETGEGE